MLLPNAQAGVKGMSGQWRRNKVRVILKESCLDILYYIHGNTVYGFNKNNSEQRVRGNICLATVIQGEILGTQLDLTIH